MQGINTSAELRKLKQTHLSMEEIQMFKDESHVDLSRNNRHTIVNALVDPEDARSRNNFIPSFNEDTT